ncbi:MAG: dockerin type I domain-containing protein, partial [Eubacteriales bacterium]
SVGITTVYAAEGTFSTNFGSYKYRAENRVTGEAGEHAFQSEFTWTPAVDEEGNPTGGYTAVTATLSCEVCGISYENVEAVVTEERKDPTCKEEGSVVYTAVATVKGEDDHEIISATDTRTEVLEKVPHIYIDGICEVCGEEEPPEFTISGEVTSYTTSDEASPEVTLTLMNEDGTTVLDTIVLPEGETAYSFAVKAGTYTLKVEKENHVTRTYTITVDTESVEQNVVICPIGDVNLDGRINVRDYNLLFKFIAVSGEGLDDPYARLCADVNGDGSLNVRDYNAIFKHVSSSNKLW